MLSKPAGQHSGLERVLSLEIVRMTERAAVAAARLRGRGAEKKSDQAAVDAMRRELSGLMVRGECLFAATGVTDGPMLRGVQFGRDMIETETVVMCSTSGTIRWIRAEHQLVDKFK